MILGVLAIVCSIIAVARGTGPVLLECTTDIGLTYTGTVAVTATGATCIRWDANGDRWNDDSLFPHDESASAASNFCRNPDSDSRGPWCKTVGGSWGSCDIPMCPVLLVECTTDIQGSTYTGTVAVTATGETCKRWEINYDENVSHNSAFKFPHDESVSAASNFCRNPDSDSRGPWCDKVGGGWGYCDIPMCAE